MKRAPRHAVTHARRRWRRAWPTPGALVSAAWARAWTSQPPARRRVRVLVAASVLFSAVVLLTSLPVGELLTQRSALDSTARQLRSMDAANRALSGEAASLAHASTLESMARRDFGFVADGARAYQIVPSPGSPAGSTATGAEPLNSPPVAPGSARSQALLGMGAPATAPGAGSGARTASAARHGPVPGYWRRVLSSLEFWH